MADDVMKLYVWADPYPVPYGGSMVFAVAHTLGEARKLVKVGKGFRYGKYASGDAEPFMSMKLGEPTRVVSLPCAEWHEWEE